MDNWAHTHKGYFTGCLGHSGLREGGRGHRESVQWGLPLFVFLGVYTYDIKISLNTLSESEYP